MDPAGKIFQTLLGNITVDLYSIYAIIVYDF